MDLKHLNLPIFVDNHFLLPLDIVKGIIVLLGFAFSDFKFIVESLLVLFAAHETHMQIVFLLSLLVEDVFLLIEGLLQSCLILL